MWDHIVVGLGATGLSCVNFLQSQGASCCVVDTRPKPPNLSAFQAAFPEVPVYTGELSEKLLSTAKTIVLSPGLSPHLGPLQAAVKRGSRLCGDIELFAQQVQKPVLGITGSNGKSTVTTLVAELLKASGFKVAVGGNLGVPALTLLQEPEPDLYVLELSSFQLEMTDSLKLSVASLLNLSEDHLDRHQTMQAYWEAKQRIYAKAAIAVVAQEDPASIPKHPDFRGKIVYFSQQAPSEGHFGLKEVNNKLWLAYGTELFLASETLGLTGRPNVLNALAAVAMVHASGVPLSGMTQTLESFKGLPHRCQAIGRFSEVLWVNDSKGTNVGATLAAVHGLALELRGKIVLIAGGDGKGADFSPLLSLLPHLRGCVLLGQDSPKLAALFAPHLKTLCVETLSQAVFAAQQMALSGDGVLLSPACSSLDMFENYARRGELFTQAVKEQVFGKNYSN